MTIQVGQLYADLDFDSCLIGLWIGETEIFLLNVTLYPMSCVPELGNGYRSFIVWRVCIVNMESYFALQFYIYYFIEDGQSADLLLRRWPCTFWHYFLTHNRTLSWNISNLSSNIVFHFLKIMPIFHSKPSFKSPTNNSYMDINNPRRPQSVGYHCFPSTSYRAVIEKIRWTVACPAWSNH